MHKELSDTVTIVCWFSICALSITCHCCQCSVNIWLVVVNVMVVGNTLHDLYSCLINPLEPEINLNGMWKLGCCCTENTVHLHSKDKLVSAVHGSSCCLLWNSCKTLKCSLGSVQSVLMVKWVVHIVIGVLKWSIYIANKGGFCFETSQFQNCGFKSDVASFQYGIAECSQESTAA